MNIEDLCKDKTPVTVWTGETYLTRGVITQVGVMPGHMARIGFALTHEDGTTRLITEACTIKVEKPANP